MYDPASPRAEEFIDPAEVAATLDESSRLAADEGAVRAILDKAAERKGLGHREASVLLACDMPGLREEIHALAARIKQDFYGSRIVMFAPLYLSNYCVNS